MKGKEGLFLAIAGMLICIGCILICVASIKQEKRIGKLENEINDIKAEIQFRDYIEQINN